MSRRQHLGAGGVYIAKKRRQETHLCAVPGCECRIRTSLLMCPSHWNQVPDHLRDALGTAWEEFKYFPGDRAVAKRYSEARRAAIDAVRQKEATNA